jgi:RNA polymerase sigma-32 factor
MVRGLSACRTISTRFKEAPNLDACRERELLTRARADTDDGRAALTELWMSHGKLVAAIAGKYRRSGIDPEDLINAGHLGLHTAITRFDTSRFDTRLSAYAIVWIRWYINDFIRRNAAPVRLPESRGHRQLAQSSSRLMIEARKACEREGVDATDGELHRRIGRRIGLTENEVGHGLRLIQDGRTSLHDPEGGTEAAIADHAAPTADDIHERMDHQRLRSRIRSLADEVLGERERQLFLARAMADTDNVPSLEDFAARFGVSTARVHQIELSARRKIAASLSASGWTEAAGDAVVSKLSHTRARRTSARPDFSASAKRHDMKRSFELQAAE